MFEKTNQIINKIIDRSLILSSIVILPLNIIVWFALSGSEYKFPSFVTPSLSIIVIILLFFRNELNIKQKTWSLIFVFFLAGVFTLILGLLDMASLWFILAIIYTLFISEKNEAIIIFIISFIFTLITGILMMTKSTFIPIDYGFDNCQFACVVIRIFNFLFMGFLIYYILNLFFSTLKLTVKDLIKKSNNLKKLNAKLKVEIQEKNELQSKILETIIFTEEKERKRIASDLHDGLGPVMSAIQLYFQAYIDAKTEDKFEIKNKLEDIISGAIKDVSRISHNISPYVLKNHGLIAALNNFISELSITNKISFDLQFDEIERFDLQSELTIYRAVTELINNTIKHASASNVTLKIKKTTKKLHIYYSDNGKGFDITSLQAGMGLVNIKNRVNSLKGKLVIESKKNKGMKAEIEIPIY